MVVELVTTALSTRPSLLKSPYATVLIMRRLSSVSNWMSRGIMRVLLIRLGLSLSADSASPVTRSRKGFWPQLLDELGGGGSTHLLDVVDFTTQSEGGDPSTHR